MVGLIIMVVSKVFLVRKTRNREMDCASTLFQEWKGIGWIYPRSIGIGIRLDLNPGGAT